MSLEALFFKGHFPLIYLLVMTALFFLSKVLFWAGIIFTFSLIIFLSCKAFKDSKKIVLSFIVKPILDICSIMIIYIFF
ncbi:membrane protein [Candidatus Omnitrophus magneticus]|uniref:Membrane protein n=1 Tax=Candidatus Omnitrophus magneticus TaxID=1609969 RepID=A0A0F0CUM4_9BACT|nr:membrane protein [Candidatus Omnitrophus magneticus]